MRFLERYLDENNFIRIYRMQEFGSKVMADFFIESTLKDLNSTVYIFLRKRQESENYVVVSVFKKYQTYRGVNLYWMLKEKIKENDSIELYRNQNYRYS